MAESTSESCIVVGQNPSKAYKGTMKKYDIGRNIDEYYAAFYGIPYARIPPGRMKRYQAPEPLLSRVTRSTSTYEANVTGKICTQLSSASNPPRYIGSSDCLYLNIYVPKKPEVIKELLPVLVYIHGGGFSNGSNTHKVHTPDFILQHGVVFVTINYRLGLLGFLNMRTRDCPGNAGLKDQVKALEWIRDNIECFKGDPHNVTLSGFSAGATCVNLHLIAPASKDLFHKAILHAGGVYSPWGFRDHRWEQIRVLSKDSIFCDLLSSAKESYKLYTCASALLDNDRKIHYPHLFSANYGPSMEKFKEEAFIIDNLEEMMKNVEHDKPIIAGIAKAEGLACFLLDNEKDRYTHWINDDSKFLRALMENFRWSDETARKFIDVIRDKYFPGRLNLSATQKRILFANFARDIFFRRFYDNFKFGPEKTVHKNLYVYRFDHFSQLCQRSMLTANILSEPTHGDELKYLYCPEQDKRFHKQYIDVGPKQNTEIQDVMNHMCSLWANFCKTGVPKSNYDPNNVEWRRHTEENPCYLSISTNLELKEEALFQDEWRWLNELVNAQPTVESLSVTPEEEQE